MTNQRTHKGGCHCGAVTYEVKGPRKLMAVSRNCSICRMSGFLHYIVEKDQFTLLTGEDNLTEYRFGSGAARHLFCKTCGIKSFYFPRSHPGGVSVNVHCLDRATIDDLDITLFDGENWEKNIDQIR
ncbi:MAG: GFA family protein [Alphaproteobacteria bacterium]|nr:MAG: GFA family protein [Alphaproteobacteria bacterium]